MASASLGYMCADISEGEIENVDDAEKQEDENERKRGKLKKIKRTWEKGTRGSGTKVSQSKSSDDIFRDEDSLSCDDFTEEDGLDIFTTLLCQLRNWPRGYQGFQIVNGGIIIAVLRSHVEETRSYMLENDITLDGPIRITFRETKLPLQYCVERGTEVVKVAEVDFKVVEADMNMRNIQQYQGRLGNRDLPYGTIGCIASSRSSAAASEMQRFLITARHNFEPRDVVNDSGDITDDENGVPGNYFSQNSRHFQRVSRLCKGVLGQCNGKSVDIAILPIQVHPQTKNSITPTVFNGAIAELEGVVVEMLGARLNRVEGKIVDITSLPRIGSGSGRECIGVISIEKKQYLFSDRGDSGATVVRRNAEGTITQIIGLVCTKGLREVKSPHGDDRVCTWVVLLRNCFSAIQQRFGIELFIDDTWKNCRAEFV